MLRNRSYNKPASQMSPGIRLTIPIAQAYQAAKCGYKAATLAKLISAGLHVPRGFVIVSDAYHWHLRTSYEHRSPTYGLNAEDQNALCDAILSQPIAEDVWSAIVRAYRELALQCGESEPQVAVRSSAVYDLPGTYESRLNVRGLEELEAAIKRVWASVWSERAMAVWARLRPSREPSMAVIVQRMVDRSFGGIVYTANPITGDPRRVVVSCESKSGESEHFEIDLRDVDSVFLVPSEERQAKMACDSLEGFVAERALLLEDLFESCVEVEWTHDGDRLWILQVRPMKDVPAFFPLDSIEDLREGEWQKVSIKPVSPLFKSLLDDRRSGLDGFTSRLGRECRRLINSYVYRKRAPIDDKDSLDDPVRIRKRDIDQGFSLLERWRTDLVTSVHQASVRIMGSDLSKIGDASLVCLLEEATKAWRRSVDLLECSWYPSVRFPSLLREFLGSGTDGECLYQRLLSGIASGLILRDAKLQDLGDRFAAAKRSGQLDDVQWWSAFKRDVEKFAREYGYAFIDLGEAYDIATWKSWVEDLEPVYRMIGALSRRGKRSSIVTLHSSRLESARLAEQEASEIYGGKTHTYFRELLELSRGWLTFRIEAELACAIACTALRLVLIESGKRLAKSRALASKDDIFYLHWDELPLLIRKPEDVENSRTAALIAKRKHELWLNRRLSAPDSLRVDAGGTEAFKLQPSEGRGSNSQAEGEVHGELPIGLVSSQAECLVIRGQVVGSGTATGRARVASTVAEAGDIENGEILVVKSPGLAWTPFWGVASAFVCEEPDDFYMAPIALDYGIPIVIGCIGATSSFNSGERISVDGSIAMVKSFARADAESSEHPVPLNFYQKTRKSAG